MSVRNSNNILQKSFRELDRKRYDVTGSLRFQGIDNIVGQMEPAGIPEKNGTQGTPELPGRPGKRGKIL